MCFFASHPCLMAKSLTGTTTAASGSGLELCPTQTLTASLSFDGKIRRKSRKPLKLQALEEVGRSLMVFGGSGTVLSFVVVLLWWFDVHVASASDVRIVEMSPHSRARMLTVLLSSMLNQWGEKAKSVGRYMEKHFLLSWLVYLVFSSLTLTDAVVLCFLNGTFSSVHGYGGSLVLLSMDCLSYSLFRFWTNECWNPRGLLMQTAGTENKGMHIKAEFRICFILQEKEGNRKEVVKLRRAYMTLLQNMPSLTEVLAKAVSRK